MSGRDQGSHAGPGQPGGAGEREAQAILARRARDLARPLAGPPAEEPVGIVRFSLDGDLFGIDAGYTFEALRIRHVAALGGPGEPLAGLLSWRGDLLPLLDLGAMTGAGRAPPGVRSHALVLGQAKPAFAIGVDSVDGIVSLAGSEIHADGPLSGPYVRGVAAGGVIILHAPDLIRSYSESEVQ